MGRPFEEFLSAGISGNPKDVVTDRETPRGQSEEMDPPERQEGHRDTESGSLKIQGGK